jgi:hypothetical protein
MGILRGASMFALLTLIVGFVPLFVALAYVFRPTERNLALMRPASLAGLFGGITGCLSGFINVLRMFWSRELTAKTYQVMAVGAAEALVPVFVGFGCLTVAWLLVAVGMGRRTSRL